MNENIQKTLVLLKPDAVKRGVMGEIINRFERVGLKIVGMKLKMAEKEKAEKHYGEDIATRRGDKVRQVLLDFIQSGPVLAIVIEGVNVIEKVRLMVGETEPKNALPGTIRGDYCHVSYDHADKNNKAVANIIHASANKEDAEKEIYLWFNQDEIYDYETAHQHLVF